MGGCGGCVVAMNIYGDVPKFRTLSLSRIQYSLDAYACPPSERTLSCWSIIGIVFSPDCVDLVDLVNISSHSNKIPAMEALPTILFKLKLLRYYSRN